MAKKISDTVARLIALSRPAYVNGRWQRPAMGHAELHYLRKRLVVAGEYWPPKPLDNLAQEPPVKLTARERNRPARLAAIEENMRRMPQMVEEYRAKCRESRKQFKEKGESTEEEIYLRATGKIKQKHAWESSRDKKKKSGRMRKKA